MWNLINELISFDNHLRCSKIQFLNLIYQVLLYFGTGLYMRIFVEEVITHSYYPQFMCWLPLLRVVILTPSFQSKFLSKHNFRQFFLIKALHLTKSYTQGKRMLFQMSSSRRIHPMWAGWVPLVSRLLAITGVERGRWVCPKTKWCLS